MIASGSSSSEMSGSISLMTSDSAAGSGEIKLATGKSESGASGSISVSSGSSASEKSGSVSIRSGAALLGDGGNVVLVAGNVAGENGSGGNLVLEAGSTHLCCRRKRIHQCWNSASGTGGSVTLTLEIACTFQRRQVLSTGASSASGSVSIATGQAVGAFSGDVSHKLPTSGKRRWNSLQTGASEQATGDINLHAGISSSATGGGVSFAVALALQKWCSKDCISGKSANKADTSKYHPEQL